MAIRFDDHRADSGKGDRIARLVRIAMVIYLSPVILAVLAIGSVGVLATKGWGMTSTKLGFRGVHRAHGKVAPIAMGRAAATAQTRELA